MRKGEKWTAKKEKDDGEKEKGNRKMKYNEVEGMGREKSVK